MCKHAFENIQHFATCQVVGPIFEALARLAGVDMSGASLVQRERFAAFALTPTGAQLEEGWINMHLLLWKYIIFHLTQVETEDATFHAHAVWQNAWARFEKKALAKQENVRTVVLRAESRGEDPPDLERKGRPLAPIADLSGEGKILWNGKIKEELAKLATAPLTPAKGRGRGRGRGGGRR